LEVSVVDFFLLTAHEQAYKERGVLHRDIHISNIFIDEGGDDDDIFPEAKGMLGDWGHAQCSDIPPHHRMNFRAKASEKPAVRTSQHEKQKKKAPARPKSPTPSDSQMSDATSTKLKLTADDLYAAFNPWYHEAPKELLDRTVSRQPLTQRY